MAKIRYARLPEIRRVRSESKGKRNKLRLYGTYNRRRGGISTAKKEKTNSVRRYTNTRTGDG